MEKYVLIVTEKPDAAQKIAEYLDRRGKPQKVKEKGVPYYIACRDKRLVVVLALGHLYTVSDPDGKRDCYPVFNFKWVPRHVVEKNAKHVQTWIETISKLAENAQEFVNACDYDVEGSLIGYCILKYACGNKDGVAKRMKFSTMTKAELEKSYEEPLAHLDFALIEAGKTRHEVDWLYGVNFSRALMHACQKLPPTINYKTILDGLSREPAYERLVVSLLKKDRLYPYEGKKEDPAHPAIYPTGNLPERYLSDRERKVWDVIVRRFMAVFGEPSIKKRIMVSVDVGDYRFFLSGSQVIKDGWMLFYGSYKQTEEAILPPLKVGDVFPVKRLIRASKFTKAPPRFNPVSLLKKMENAGIGTKASRADIIETLYHRKYIFEKQMRVTDLGFNVAEILHKYCPEVVSVKLTRELEEKMEQIQSGKENRENVLLEAIDQLKLILEGFILKERVIGQVLSGSVETARTQERVLGICPLCGTGKLMILYSRKSRKRFIGCTSYFQGMCKASFPLPQKGKVKPARKNCRSCGWPLVQVWTKVGRPWMPCFNPNCPAKVKKT